MASITSGLQSNEVISERVENLENVVNRKNVMGSIAFYVDKEKGTFKLKKPKNGERYPILILPSHQNEPLEVVSGLLIDGGILTISNTTIKSLTHIDNADGTLSFTVISNVTHCYSDWCLIVPKEYII